MKSNKDVKKVFILLAIVILMAGCSELSDPDIEGYILEVNEQRLLVMEDVSLEEYEEMKDKTVSEIDKESEYINLIYLSYDDVSDFEKGDHVNVWLDGGVDHSYPSQAAAKNIVANE
ncbi:DUF3221 domain-containing protein [Gracilibacillus salitolerans]|nr:DUF3221 domain-containing protein [Gracilibacillus salitolerans]